MGAREKKNSLPRFKPSPLSTREREREREREQTDPPTHKNNVLRNVNIVWSLYVIQRERVGVR